MMTQRRDYPLKLVVNDVFITKVIIDSHYEIKHSESINDELILELIQLLNEKSFEPDSVFGRFSYFVLPALEYRSKIYKLIWLMDSGSYLGVVNIYRSKDGLSKKK